MHFYYFAEEKAFVPFASNYFMINQAKKTANRHLICHSRMRRGKNACCFDPADGMFLSLWGIN